jgi:hypothetical protein
MSYAVSSPYVGTWVLSNHDSNAARRPRRPRHPYAVPRTFLQCVCTRLRNCIEQLSPCPEYAPLTARFPAWKSGKWRNPASVGGADRACRRNHFPTAAKQSGNERRLASSSIKQRGSVMLGRIINSVYRGLCRQYLMAIRHRHHWA